MKSAKAFWRTREHLLLRHSQLPAPAMEGQSQDTEATVHYQDTSGLDTSVLATLPALLPA